MKRYGLIVLGVLLLVAGGAGIGAAETAEERRAQANAELQQGEREIAALRQRVQALKGKQAELQKFLNALRGEVDAVRAKLAATTQQLDRLTADKNVTERRFNDETAKLNQRQQLLGRRVREIYKRGGNAAYWQVLFTAKDFGDLIRRFRFLKLVMEQDAALIRDLRTERLRLDAEKRKLEAQVAEIAAVKKQQDAEKAALDRKQKGYQAALAAAGQQRTQAEGAIRTLEANARRLRDLIKILTPPLDPHDPPRRPPPPPGNKPWPLAGVGRAQVIRPFGSYQHPEYHVQVSSNGIDISVARGSTVKSIAAGTVVEVTNMQGYGTTLVIDHGNGAMSVYAYLGGMSVAKGARVAAGQAIGTTGVRPDDNIAALHLETYSNGTPQNPLGWLVAR